MNKRVLVISPWGLQGGYSGPLVLMNRLFGEVNSSGSADITILFRDRGIEQRVSWAKTIGLQTGSGENFSRVSQLIWIIKTSMYLLRHAGAFDVVHLHGLYATNLIPALLIPRRVLLTGIAVVENGDLSQKSTSLGRVKRHTQRRVLRRCKALFALSDGIRRELEELGAADGAIHSLGNPVSPEFAFKRVTTPGNPIRIGFVGKLGPRKSPHLLLESLAIMNRDCIMARLTFVGPFENAAYEESFRTKAAELGISSEIQILQPEPREIPSILRDQMDVFALPSQSEGMPGALAEAMYASLPCVVTDVGAMGDVVRRSGAGIVVEGTPHALAAAIARLQRDSDCWRDCSTSAYAFADEEFSTRRTAEVYSHAVFVTSKLN